MEVIMKISVFINGTPTTVENKTYSFKEVVELAGFTEHFEKYTMSSSLENGKEPNLYSKDDMVVMKEKMRLNIDITDNS